MKTTLLKGLLVLLVLTSSAGFAALFTFRLVLAHTVGCEICGDRPVEHVTARYGNTLNGSRSVDWRVCTWHASNLPEELSTENLFNFFCGAVILVTPLLLLFDGLKRLLKKDQRLAVGVIHGSVTLWCIVVMASGLYADLKMLLLFTAGASVGTMYLACLAIRKFLKPEPQSLAFWFGKA